MHPTERFGLMIWPFSRDSRAAPRQTLAGEQPPSSSSAADALLAVAATLPDPFLVLDSEGIVILANRHAQEALDTDPAGEHISATIRAPVILEAVVQVVATGEAVRTDYERRSPLDRRFEAFIAPIARPGQDDSPRGTPAVLILLRDLTRAAAARAHAGRFRRQCQPRAAHAARLAARLHRDAAGAGPRRRGGARALPRDHARAGGAHDAADRRSPVAVADRDERASAARRGGRPRTIAAAASCDTLQPLAGAGREVRSRLAGRSRLAVSGRPATNWSRCSRT